jgi:hypothetical protein
MMISYAWFDAFPDQITAEDYAEMPEELSRSIEVIDGHTGPVLRSGRRAMDVPGRKRD